MRKGLRSAAPGMGYRRDDESFYGRDDESFYCRDPSGQLGEYQGTSGREKVRDRKGKFDGKPLRSSSRMIISRIFAFTCPYVGKTSMMRDQDMNLLRMVGC